MAEGMADLHLALTLKYFAGSCIRAFFFANSKVLLFSFFFLSLFLPSLFEIGSNYVALVVQELTGL